MVGNPALFTQSVFEMDFSQGQNGQFRANGGAWQDIPETVTISGPQGSLRIAEATAVLSGDYQ